MAQLLMPTQESLPGHQLGLSTGTELSVVSSIETGVVAGVTALSTSAWYPYLASTTYNQVIQTIPVNPAPHGLREIAISNDGHKLFVTTPDGANDGNGEILVVKINPEDRPTNPTQNLHKWNQQIAAIEADLGLEGISTTSDSSKIVFTDRKNDALGDFEQYLSNNRTLVEVDNINTANARMRGDYAVPTLFNGNFDAITDKFDEQSIPGWSFYNGADNALQSHLVDVNQTTIDPALSVELDKLQVDRSQHNYALQLNPGDSITHNRFVVPDWGVLRFDLHIPPTTKLGTGGQVLVTLQAADGTSTSSVIYLQKADEKISTYLADTQKIDYGTQGFETFDMDVPNNQARGIQYNFLSNLPDNIRTIIKTTPVTVPTGSNPANTAFLMAEPEVSSNDSNIVSADASVWHNGITKDSSLYPGTVNFGSSQVGSSQIGLNDVSTSEISTNQLGISQIGSGQTSMTQAGSTQIGISEDSLRQTGLPKMSIAEVSSSEINSFQVGFSQSNVTQVNATQVNSSQINYTQINPTKISLPSSISSQQLFSVHTLTPESITTINDTAQTSGILS